MKGYLGSKTPIEIRDSLETPDFLFNYYNKFFNFTTDVAATFANRKCNDFRTNSLYNTDSLLMGWGRVNWCNPPYSDITPWIKKAIVERDKGNVTVVLVPEDSSTGWGGLALAECSEYHNIVGRISFIDPQTRKPKNGNNKGSRVYIFSPFGFNRGQSVTVFREDMK